MFLHLCAVLMSFFQNILSSEVWIMLNKINRNIGINICNSHLNPRDKCENVNTKTFHFLLIIKTRNVRTLYLLIHRHLCSVNQWFLMLSFFVKVTYIWYTKICETQYVAFCMHVAQYIWVWPNKSVTYMIHNIHFFLLMKWKAVQLVVMSLPRF